MEVHPMPHSLDGIATRLFQTAIRDEQAGELLACLFDGGSATVDPSGRLVMIDSDQLKQFRGTA